jgi:hypothetical protein
MRSPSNPNQLSPRGAIIVGILCMVCGAYPVLAGLGIVHGRPAPGVQPWVVVAAGSMFILAGFAVINGYAVAGGSQANGDLADGAPFAARVTQFVLGTLIVGLMFAVFAWVAFGSGERHFSSSFSMPGFSSSGQSSERSGRIVFGIGAVLIGLFFVFGAVSGAKRLWRDGQGRSPVRGGSVAEPDGQ